MSQFRFCLLLAVICSCSYLGQADTSPATITIPITTTTVKPETTTTLKPETTTEKTTTSASTTTEKTTTTITTPSTTTSTKAPTTTPVPTTPPTPAPSPPTPAPSPAPAPGPLPPPTQGLWTFTDTKDNYTCIVVQFAAQLNITYTKLVANVSSLGNTVLNVPGNATVVSGSCAGDQFIQLGWPSLTPDVYNNLTIVYHKNETINHYELKSLSVSLTPDNFINGSSTAPIELYHDKDWSTPLATSYRCKLPTQLNMSSESVTAATLTLSRVQEEAYRNATGHEFSAAHDCSGGDVPDAVPIAVGCALGGLVVVVLVAYLVGRRRSAARGYLSM